MPLTQKEANGVLQYVIKDKVRGAMNSFPQAINELMRQLKPEDPTGMKVDLLSMFKDGAVSIFDEWIEKAASEHKEAHGE